MTRFQPDSAPEKIRIKDSYRERIFNESQQLGKSYLETLYFMVDCYFAFKKGAFPVQQLLAPAPSVIAITNSTNLNQVDEPIATPSPQPSLEELEEETFSLDFEL